jgi:hypothetical protein
MPAAHVDTATRPTRAAPARRPRASANATRQADAIGVEALTEREKQVAARRRSQDESRDRRDPLPQPQDRGDAPAKHLPQARRRSEPFEPLLTGAPPPCRRSRPSSVPDSVAPDGLEFQAGPALRVAVWRTLRGLAALDGLPPRSSAWCGRRYGCVLQACLAAFCDCLEFCFAVFCDCLNAVRALCCCCLKVCLAAFCCALKARLCALVGAGC